MERGEGGGEEGVRTDPYLSLDASAHLRTDVIKEKKAHTFVCMMAEHAAHLYVTLLFFLSYFIFSIYLPVFFFFLAATRDNPFCILS
jgi:hypothetical protein